MSMDSFFRTVAVITFISLILMRPAVAQMSEMDVTAPVLTDVSDAAQRMKDEEVTIMRDEYAGKYNTSTLENLSKLYWRLGAFDFDDDEAVANYIKINDCKIYTEYLNDDLEWKEIIKVMKDHLKKNSTNFPLNFQFVLELHLGRYDSEKGGFPIVDKTGFKDSKRISVRSAASSKSVCYGSSDIKDYPQSLIMILNEGFTLDTLNLDEHVAQAYILRKKAEYLKLSEEQRIRAYERPAYLRLRVTFSQYNGNMKNEKGDVTALVHGRIDGYEIFEDLEEKRMMLSVQYDEKGQPAAPTTEGVEETGDGGGVMRMQQPESTSP